jgi:co-chaperonin GroES (HSP10)
MTDKEWEKFFDLMGKVVNLEGLSANEKAAEVRAQAVKSGDEVNLEEFTGWFAE